MDPGWFNKFNLILNMKFPIREDNASVCLCYFDKFIAIKPKR